MTLLQVLSGAPPSEKASGICPYKGLEFFDYNDEDPKYFFGREALVSRLIEHVRQSNFLALAGASGNGKSSVLRAGLLHQIKQGQLIEGSDQWRIRVTRPDREPMTNLAMAFVREGLGEVDRAAELGKVQGLLSEGATGLKRLIQVAPEPRVILVIDQFEEVFTRCENDDERERYLAILMGALERTEEKLCLIIAMRSDFIVKCHENKYSGLAKRLEQQMIAVLPMETDELKSAIIKPAEKVGLDIEGELVTEIINDIQGTPGSLPLLQYTLKELWQDQQDNQLQLIAYQSLGGIQGTLDKRATAIYDSFDEAEQWTVRHIFQQLTQLGEGTEDTRRRVFQEDLVSEPKHPAERVQQVIEKLSCPEHRLLVTSEVTSKATESKSMAIVDVAHEALIRHWQLLRQWIEKNRDLLRRQRKIEASAVAWREQEKASGYLLQGRPLIEAIEFNQQQANSFPLSDTAKSFINRSLRQRRWNRLKTASWLIIPAVIIGGIVDFYQKEASIRNNIKHLKMSEIDDKKNIIEKLVKGCRAREEQLWLPTYFSERLFGNCRNTSNLELINTKLISANLQFSNLSGTNLRQSDLSISKLNNADLRFTNISYANLSHANLSHANLSHANLSHTNLSHAILNSADLNNTDLTLANFNKANLCFTSFSNFSSSFTNFSNANLRFASFSNVGLNLANFSNANLSGTNFFLINFRGVNFSNTNLRNTDLRNTKFSGTILSNTDLSNANLSSTDLSENTTYNINLSNANLSNANLKFTFLTTANLSKTIFLATDLRHTIGLTKNQFQMKNPPLICNSPLPKDIEINPDRDCDQLPQILANRYPKEFATLEQATEYVNEQRKKTWD